LRRYFPRKIIRKYKDFRLIKKFKFIANRRYSKKNVGFLANYKNRLLARLLFKKIFLVVYRLQSSMHFYRIFADKRKSIYAGLGFFEIFFKYFDCAFSICFKINLSGFFN